MVNDGRYHSPVIRTGILLSVVVAVGATITAWVIAGRAEGPQITIVRPTTFIGQTAFFEVTVQTPDAELRALDAHVEQNGNIYPLFSLGAGTSASVQQESSTSLRISRAFDRSSHPDLVTGPARVVVRATRPVLYGYREATSEATLDVTVRLAPPRLSALSTLHYINHGGSEFIIYRVSPADVDSGVRVGDREYPGYPASGAGLTGADDLRVAFFSLAYDQDLATPIELYARDPASNAASARFDFRVFEQQFRRSRIPLSDRFLQRVVPDIVSNVADLADERVDGSTSPLELLDLYLFINGELRQRNRQTVAELAPTTASTWLWNGPFRQLSNSQVESGFADHRTYVYANDEVDQQVHLGFDLASTANAPIRAANSGTVVFADYLGIYGNCVILDHGMGLQSLYAHLSSIDVTQGTKVDRDQQLGLSGQTGLAGGDHLHFTMLLQGRPVTPMEWWDEHWIEDRVQRKLRDAGQS